MDCAEWIFGWVESEIEAQNESGKRVLLKRFGPGGLAFLLPECLGCVGEGGERHVCVSACFGY